MLCIADREFVESKLAPRRRGAMKRRKIHQVKENPIWIEEVDETRRRRRRRREKMDGWMDGWMGEKEEGKKKEKKKEKGKKKEKRKKEKH